MQKAMEGGIKEIKRDEAAINLFNSSGSPTERMSLLVLLPRTRIS